MAIFGLGANYNGTDKADDFITNGIAYVGWGYEDASSLHQIMRSIRLGDIIYIKFFPPHVGLIIKAVGLVRNPYLPSSEHGQIGVQVTWHWKGPSVTVGKIGDAYNVRSNTLYEEHNPVIGGNVLDLLMSARG